MGTTPVPPPPKRGSFPLKTPRKESPRGDEQDAERFVVLRGFYAENDGDESVVFSNTDGPTGWSRPSCGAHTALAGNIETQLDKKKAGKGASFQTICTSIESPLKTMQDDGLGLRFHASFLVFFEVGRLRRREDLAVSADVVCGSYNTEIGRFSTELAAKNPTGVFSMKNYVR